MGELNTHTRKKLSVMRVGQKTPATSKMKMEIDILDVTVVLDPV